MESFFARMKEPSTWSGLAVLATLFGVPVDQVNAATGVAAAVAAAAVFMKEKGGQ